MYHLPLVQEYETLQDLLYVYLSHILVEWGLPHQGPQCPSLHVLQD